MLLVRLILWLQVWSLLVHLVLVSEKGGPIRGQ
jgi:hypothetical protein